MKRPLFFIYGSFLYVFFQLLITLAALGVIFVGFFIVSTLRQSLTSIPMLFFYAIDLVVFFYFSTAFFGSLLRAYWNALSGKSTEFLDFYRYALNNGFEFFWIFVVKLAVEMVFLAPLLILYLLVLKTAVFPYKDALIVFAALGAMFLANFLFHGAYLSAAINEVPAQQAIRMGFTFLRRRHIMALILFGIYAVVWLTGLIPLVQLLTLFVTLPLLLAAMLLFFDESFESKGSGK